MIIVVLAIGPTDVVFALDSIPAIFGLTTEATSSSPPTRSR